MQESSGRRLCKFSFYFIFDIPCLTDLGTVKKEEGGLHSALRPLLYRHSAPLPPPRNEKKVQWIFSVNICSSASDDSNPSHLISNQ